ncbi:hypothetical protein AWC38_SpisGene7805 [Stylophora pistillata]|uniref:Uncharacterized protein n=1 Tax=Stylophora pistillata TaxID=50429 RepID=A0A2B4SG34_STYPI|nr:hypothetical protein AWC38_SpisGene7805 [Stylophora pistillata]
MKDSKLARELEAETDSMIISLMDEMKQLNLQERKSYPTTSSLDDMKIVLEFYDKVIEQFWKIAENVAKTSAEEERHAGTVFMGSCADGTCLPEVSDTFDMYVMEEDPQYELHKDLKAVDPDFVGENSGTTPYLKVALAPGKNRSMYSTEAPSFLSLSYKGQNY